MLVKQCTGCNEIKSVDAFNLIARGGTKLRPRCKSCTSHYRAERYRDRGGINDSYAQVLRRDYGMTLAEYEERVRKQGNRCAICRRGETIRINGKVRRLTVDHDHVTGQVRELLCQRCNILVWALEDNHTTIRNIEAYLIAHRASFAAGAPI